MIRGIFSKSEEETTTDITYTCLDQDVHRAQQQEAEENQMAYEFSQVIQELERKNEDQLFSCSFVSCCFFFGFLSWLLSIFFLKQNFSGFSFGLCSSVGLTAYYQPLDLYFQAGILTLIFSLVYVLTLGFQGPCKTCLSNQKHTKNQHRKTHTKSN